MTAQMVDTQEDFDKIIATSGDKLVVVDFYATWCGPCKIIGPKFEKMAAEFPTVTFLKVDVDEIEELVEEHGVKVMPSFFFYKNGKKIDGVEGNNPDMLREKLNELSK